MVLKLGLSEFLESQKFTNYAAALAGAEYSLKKSQGNRVIETKLEMILNTMDSGIVCVNETGIITLINCAAQVLLGLQSTEVIGQSTEWVFPEFSFTVTRPDGPRLLNLRDRELGTTVTALQLRR